MPPGTSERSDSFRQGQHAAVYTVLVLYMNDVTVTSTLCAHNLHYPYSGFLRIRNTIYKPFIER